MNFNIFLIFKKSPSLLKFFILFSNTLAEIYNKYYNNLISSFYYSNFCYTLTSFVNRPQKSLCLAHSRNNRFSSSFVSSFQKLQTSHLFSPVVPLAYRKDMIAARRLFPCKIAVIIVPTYKRVLFLQSRVEKVRACPSVTYTQRCTLLLAHCVRQRKGITNTH